jgi:hypothetical protein
MVKLYAQKITDKEMNQQTNEAWKLADVPMLWRAEVEAMLTSIKSIIKSMEAENE